MVLGMSPGDFIARKTVRDWLEGLFPQSLLRASLGTPLKVVLGV